MYQRNNDYDLRSRSLLIAKNALVLELLGREGGEVSTFTLDRAGAAELLTQAEEGARRHGLGWERGPVELTPSKKLADLIRQSRRLRQAGGGDDQG